MIADTIYEQLGGKRFSLMTGAKNLLAGDNYLSMHLPRNKSRANRLRIELTPDDLYLVEFMRYSPKTFETVLVKHLDGVSVDQLGEVFTTTTGFHTTL